MPAASPSPESGFDRRAYPPAFAFSEWIAADGWRNRAYAWAPLDSVRPRGSMLFQSGRGDFIEKYLEACDHWWRLGWAVEGFDWRGQGGSGRLDPGNSGDDRISFDPLIDDLEAYVSEWRLRTPGPHVIVAHSMGGHVAFRMLAERGVALDALVLVAPMLAINTGVLPLSIVRIVVGAMASSHWARRAAWRDPIDNPRRQQRLTADKQRYSDSQWWKQRHPELSGGVPSWRWIQAAVAGADRIAADRLEAVHTPMLMLAAGQDRLVDDGAIVDAVSRLPDATLRFFPTAAHEILREADDNRLPALTAIDDFLAVRAPVP